MVALAIALDESCHSFSSSILVKDSKIRPQQQQRPTLDPVQSKCIEIDEDRNTYHSDPRPVEERVGCWYVKKDFASFRSSAREVVEMAMREQDKVVHGKELKPTYFNIMRKMYTAVRKLDYELEDATELLTREKSKQLRRLYRRESQMELLGLEFYSVKGLKEDAQKVRDEIQDTVYEIQLEQRKGMWTEGEVEDELRDSCRAFSQGPTLFAQLVARACYGEEFATKDEEKNGKSQKSNSKSRSSHSKRHKTSSSSKD